MMSVCFPYVDVSLSSGPGPLPICLHMPLVLNIGLYPEQVLHTHLLSHG